MIFRTRPFGTPRGAIRPNSLLRSPAAFPTRRSVFGARDLREDRITLGSYLADDLSAEARRALRGGEMGQ